MARPKRVFLAALFTTLLAFPVGATILTFDVPDTGLPLFPPDGYGDNVDQAFVNGVTYLEGAGFTPDVSIEFLPDPPSTSEYSIFETGYAVSGSTTLLPNALGSTGYDVAGEVVLTPTSGAQVVLHGFDIGTWSALTVDTEIRIWDDQGSRSAPNLLDYAQQMVPGTVYQPLPDFVVATGPLHIFISNLGSTGLDNLSFSQVPSGPSVPALGPIGLLALTAGLLGSAGRHRRRAAER